jgi:alkylhydroperoxidase family enzyme
MARIDFPDRGLGEHADWMLARPDMAMAMGGLSSAVYGTSTLSKREREAARYTIALLNDCAVCRQTRVRPASADQPMVEEGFYAEIVDWRASAVMSEREKLAAEFAQLFALDHQNMTDEFWARLRTAYADDEIADLTMSCAMWLGMGRAMAVLGVRAPEEGLLV